MLLVRKDFFSDFSSHCYINESFVKSNKIKNGASTIEKQFLLAKLRHA